MSVHAFLSFQEEDIALVRLFRGQAKNQNSDLEFSDYSIKEPINSGQVAYIKSKIRKMIRKSSVVLCLIGHTTHASPWVEWELETAYDLDKCLIGVRLYGDYWDAVPAALDMADAEIVGWRIDDIMYAIDGC